MAIAFVSGSCSTANNPTSGNFPLGTFSNNDVAIFWWYARDESKTFTDNSSGKLTIMYEDVINAGATNNGSLTIARRVLQTGDLATDMAWTSNSTTGVDTFYGSVVFSGVDTTTPIDADSGTPATQDDTNDPDPPAVTVATANAAVVCIFGKNNDYTSISPPTNYTDGGSNSSTAGADGSSGAAYRLNLGTGSENPGAWTLGGGLAGDDGIVYTLALKPAASSTSAGWYYASQGGWW